MTELTGKMRICAAYLTGTVLAHIDDNRIYDTPEQHARAVQDAAALLIEAAALLDDAIAKPAEPEMLGEPMPLLPFVPFQHTDVMAQAASEHSGWVVPGGPLPGVKASGTRSPRACPRCDSRAYKRVFRKERKMYLHCGGCGHEWLFSEAARA